jgi:GT2 family glycosyltransferase
MESQYQVKVIAVDNNSSDDTVSLIRSTFPDVAVIANNYNEGFGGGNNQAIKIALAEGADYVFLLNQDAWVQGNTIGNLIESFNGNPAFGIISPLHLNGAGDKLDKAFESYLLKDRKGHDVLTNGSKGITESNFINAAAWMVSRDCLERVGGFGYLFKQYGEDRDFIQRLHYYKLKLGFILSAHIYHDRPEKRFSFETVDQIVWYYSIGAKVRLADISKTWGVAYVSVLFWFVKDIVLLLIRGKAYSLHAFVKVIRNVLIGSKNDIRVYRDKIDKGTRYLFIS